MDRPPLPEPVARRARSYLAALVPAGRTSDAWHELVADVTYWGDREELPVLRLAHQVVLQHERVTDEVATLALDELGISSPDSVATVLDVSPADAEVLLDRVAEVQRPPDVHVFDAEAGAVGTREDPVADDAPDAEAGDDPVPEPTQPTTPATAPQEPEATAQPTGDRDGARAVRIGFEEDDVIEVGGWDDEPAAGLDRRRWMAIAAVVLVAALLLWLLAG